MTAVVDACAECLRRTDLIAALSGRIEVEWRLRRGRPQSRSKQWTSPSRTARRALP